MNAIHRGVAMVMALAGMTLLAAPPARAAPPTLFTSPANESPVRGDPDDLLFMPGYGLAATDRVVYQSIADTTASLTHPAVVPATSTATSGTAQVVSAGSVPYSLTVRLPTAMKPDQSYVLWVVNSANEWSTAVKINDARPLWITPDSAYATAQLAALPRSLKVVGRNLQPANGARTRVRLVGPTSYTLFAADDKNPATAIERYAARVSLPTSLQTGSYSIEVSRDGVSWIPVAGQKLTVNPDPAPSENFPVSAGGCSPEDNKDDTACVVRAIAAAKAHGGGTVTFGAGHWIIGDSNVAGVTGDGVLLPVGVNLSGAGAGVTFVQRGAAWKPGVATFTPQGRNIIQGFTFTDATLYRTSSYASQPTPILKLGAHNPNYLSQVTITHNTFDKPGYGVGAGGLPLDHVYITYNDFGGFGGGVHFVADGANLRQRLQVEDSIIAFNTFEPGSYLDPENHNGVIATGLAGGHRLDFSGNVSDGASLKYLNSPTDAKGWRAAYFWNTGGGSHEEVLISQNTASCTGDKTTDGEFITTDGAGLEAGLPRPQMASSATSNTVTIPGPLVTMPGNDYVGYWVEVLDGPGRGQVRKIASYSPDSPVTFTVSPAWDVVPRETSRIAVVTEYWQIYIVDNAVDQRQPLCTKGNLEKPSGGVIQFWGGPYADSVIEGNTQHDTDGIRVGLGYTEPDAERKYREGVSTAVALEIRGNTIDGEYDYASSCSWSGIEIWSGAGPTPGSHPPVLASGISISHNTITRADGLHGGAIDFTLGWYGGPSPGPWDLTDGALVFSNRINNVMGPASGKETASMRYATSRYEACHPDAAARRGIAINRPVIWNTVLAGNTCSSVADNLFDAGLGTRRICSVATLNGCECPIEPLAYWKFDEGSGNTAADASAGSHDGTLADGPVWNPGKTGGALNFSAPASILTVSDHSALNDLYNSGRGMTVTAWIRPASAGGGGGGRIIDKHNQGRGWFLKMNDTGSAVQFVDDQFSTAVARSSTAHSIVLNEWQHVAVTWSGTADESKIHFYVNGADADGAAEATPGSGAAQSDADAPFAIGNRPFDKAFNFDGSIDGVRVYNRVLTLAEIQSLVNGGS